MPAFIRAMGVAIIQRVSFWLGKFVGDLDQRCTRFTVPRLDIAFDRAVELASRLQQGCQDTILTPLQNRIWSRDL